MARGGVPAVAYRVSASATSASEKMLKSPGTACFIRHARCAKRSARTSSQRLASAWHRHAVCGQRNPGTVFGFNHRANIEIDAAVGAHADVVDAAYATRETSGRAALEGDIDANPLRRHLFVARENAL